MVNYISKFVGSLPSQQCGRGHRCHPAQPHKTHASAKAQQPHAVFNRVCQRQFQESVMLLRERMSAQYDSSHPRGNDGPPKLRETECSEPPLCSQQRFGSNARLKMPANTIAEETILSGSTWTGNFRSPDQLSYVERQRQAREVHSKAHPADIGSLLQPQTQKKSKLWKSALKGGLGSVDRPKDDIPGSRPQNQDIVTTTPNWPFGVNPTARRHNVNGGAQSRPLTSRELRLLLGNPQFRDGNMGPLPTPNGLACPRPPPHMYGTTAEHKVPHRVFQLPVPKPIGLKRCNAQRRSHRPPTPQKLLSYHDPYYARFHGGSAARDVNVIFPSPVELARRKSVLPQIQEVSPDSSDSGSILEPATQYQYVAKVSFENEPLPEQKPHQEGDDKGPQSFGSIAERRGREPSPAQETQHQIKGNEQNRKSALIATSRGRLSSVKGPRPAPASISASSYALSTRQSATRTSTPASEPQLKPDFGSGSKYQT
jgi:hypothetical protein